MIGIILWGGALGQYPTIVDNRGNVNRSTKECDNDFQLLLRGRSLQLTCELSQSWPLCGLGFRDNPFVMLTYPR